MKDKEMTIDSLIDFLTRIKDCGDYKIKIGGRSLYDDEWTLNHREKELEFRGYLYHEDIAPKVSQLKNDINKAFEKFYR